MMRAWWIVLLLMPGAAATSMDDPEGDVRVRSHDVSWSADPDLDMTRIEVLESVGSLQIAAERAATGDADPGLFLSFQVDDGVYRVWSQQSSEDCPPQHRLMTRMDNISHIQIACVPVAIGAAIEYSFLREWIVDQEFVALHRGMVLEKIQLETRRNHGSVSVYDAAPDDPFSHEVTSGGIVQEGWAILATRPVVASNGDGGIIAWDVRFENDGANDMAFGLEMIDLPEEWSAIFPSEVAVPPGGTRLLVYVDPPSGHVHGQTEDFGLRFSTQDGPQDLRLGVRFLETPQPSGHHPRVFLHGDGEQTWMNTLEMDESGRGPHEGRLSLNPTTPTSKTFVYPLRPPLEIGLETDMSRVGRLVAPIDPPLEGSWRYDVGLYVCSETRQDAQTSCRDAGDLIASGNTTVVGGDPGEVTVDLYPRPFASDPRFGDRLFLRVEVTNLEPTGRLEPAEGGFGPGAYADLPLRDRSLPIPSDHGLQVKVEPTDRTVGPGGSTWFEARVTNPTNTTFSIATLAEGPASWRLESGGARLGPGQEMKTFLDVQVPDDTPPGTYEVTWRVFGPTGVLTESLTVQVEDGAESTPGRDKDRTAPGPTLAVLASIAAVAMLRRRQH